ncbi:MAG: isocitrate lyase/phosphoenolpyruvate mutase family protein, partial [Thiotrichaceae bacterium]|nr:isocitrate lyase/phosphoenolpyruvate mutase family protein [Thiotrichaceae bacterium]
RNSLFGDAAGQKQDAPANFADKISQGKKAQISDDFMIIARIESLILKQGHDDAIMRAKAYVEAGADGIMIHSKEKTPDEVVKFCKEFRQTYPHVPLVVVPTSYAQISESQLAEVGVNIVIYANHMLRAAFPAMQNVAKQILTDGRCLEASEHCMSIKEIITLIPETV